MVGSNDACTEAHAVEDVQRILLPETRCGRQWKRLWWWLTRLGQGRQGPQGPQAQASPPTDSAGRPPCTTAESMDASQVHDYTAAMSGWVLRQAVWGERRGH